MSLLDSPNCCATRYPVLLVHGIMSLDFGNGLNWGRIPRTLRSRGATVGFGKQDGVGSCATNAEQLKHTIHALLADTKTEKVNIIAHSKGGLDVRHLLTQPEIEPLIASVTTLSTPHRGMKVIDKLNRLPHFAKKAGAMTINVFYRILGDKQPDFYTACLDISPTSCQALHEILSVNNPTSETAILCQSFAAHLPHLRRDMFTFFTYGLVSRYDGASDGVVPIASTRWGNFRGIPSTRGKHGVSHFDLQDRWRRDFLDFDIPLFYAALVAELKERGL